MIFTSTDVCILIIKGIVAIRFKVFFAFLTCEKEVSNSLGKIMDGTIGMRKCIESSKKVFRK